MAKVDTSILDTGPCLNFFSFGYAALLVGVLESISAELLVPEDVAGEIRIKSKEIPAYRKAGSALDWAVKQNRVVIVESRSGVDQELDRNVSAILGMKHEQSAYRAKDQGERMVIAHAKTLQARGKKAIVVINDGPGQQLATNHHVRFTDTLSILRRAARNGAIPSWGEMKKIYEAMQPHDLALPHVNSAEVQRLLHTKIYGNGSEQAS